MQPPYLIFLGGANNLGEAKTGAGLAHWRPDLCVGQNRMAGCSVDLGIANLSIDEALHAGAKTLIIGIAPDGGRLCRSWIPTLKEALAKGLDVAAGLHERLNDYSELVGEAASHSRSIDDVRHPKNDFSVGSGRPRSGMRLLTVGTDCAVGKMYATLSLEKEMRSRGLKVDFRATGQTGIFIAGDGISIDAVVADFISGASEALSPNNDEDHWDLIEGQGSLFHPSYAGVTLGLVHGSQPDVLVLCHEADRSRIDNLEDFSIPDLEECMNAYLIAARLTSPAVSFAGVCVNTSKLDQQNAVSYMRNIESEVGLPCCDPVRTGVSRIVDGLTL